MFILKYILHILENLLKKVLLQN